MLLYLSELKTTKWFNKPMMTPSNVPSTTAVRKSSGRLGNICFLTYSDGVLRMALNFPSLPIPS